MDHTALHTIEDCRRRNHLDVFHDAVATWRQAEAGNAAGDAAGLQQGCLDTLAGWKHVGGGASPWSQMDEFNRSMSRLRGPGNKVVGKVLVAPYLAADEPDASAVPSGKKRKRHE